MNVYVEVEYTSHKIEETGVKPERYFIPLDQRIEWFESVIGDEEEINIEEMLDDHITDFIEHWSSETVWCIHDYYITDYYSIQQMDRDNKLKQLGI